MEWDVAINEKVHHITAKVSTMLVYSMEIFVDEVLVKKASGATALTAQKFEIDGTSCTVTLMPDIFTPYPLLTVGDVVIGKSFTEASDAGKLSGIKLVLVIVLLSFIVQIVRTITSKEAVDPGIMVMSLVEPLFVATTLGGFLQTRHPFFGKTLRIYFLIATIFFVASLVDKTAGTTGGFMTPILFLMVMTSVPGLEKIPVPPKKQ